MTTIVLNEQSAQIPLGIVLSSSKGSEIQINDESGRPVARILSAGDEGSLPLTEAELAEIRRRRQTSQDQDITTDELLARTRALGGV